MKQFSSMYQKEMCNIALVCELECFSGAAMFWLSQVFQRKDILTPCSLVPWRWQLFCLLVFLQVCRCHHLSLDLDCVFALPVHLSSPRNPSFLAWVTTATGGWWYFWKKGCLLLTRREQVPSIHCERLHTSLSLMWWWEFGFQPRQMNHSLGEELLWNEHRLL